MSLKKQMGTALERHPFFLRQSSGLALPAKTDVAAESYNKILARVCCEASC